jgi:hypothetical protein
MSEINPVRKAKHEKLSALYFKALKVLDKYLGVDKDHTYAACQALQTVGRELQTLEHVMRCVGEIEDNVLEERRKAILGWNEVIEKNTKAESPSA